LVLSDAPLAPAVLDGHGVRYGFVLFGLQSALNYGETESAPFILSLQCNIVRNGEVVINIGGDVCPLPVLKAPFLRS